MKKNLLVTFLSIWVLLISTAVVFAVPPEEPDDDEVTTGAVYTMTNAPDGNQVVIFHRNADGTLTKTDSISTGGTGSGGGLDPLGSQHSLVLSRAKKWLLAVNAGSNEISVFRVLPNGLALTDKVDSGGSFPVSVTIHGRFVFVLNAGSSPNITGFTLSKKGLLTPLAGSTRSLSAAGAFAQVGFDPQGDTLVVTDKADSQILVFAVDEAGLPAMSPVISTSNGKTPFGFIFDHRSRLLVVEVGPNAVSSYKIRSDEMLQVISGSVSNGQKAACWIADGGRGKVFTANPGSGTLSAYQLQPGSGQLTLSSGAAGIGKTPLDLTAAADGRFLYALDPGNKGIDIFQIEPDGGLTNLGSIGGGLSLFAQGIAAR